MAVARVPPPSPVNLEAHRSGVFRIAGPGFRVLRFPIARWLEVGEKNGVSEFDWFPDAGNDESMGEPDHCRENAGTPADDQLGGSVSAGEIDRGGG